MTIKILDCTLRDGGYINNWSFKDAHIAKIIKALGASKIDVIECGYLDDKRGQKNNSTLFDSMGSVEDVFQNINLDLKTEKVIMINLGDYDISKLEKKNAFIDGIRIAFHKNEADKAFEVACKIKDLGYKLYFQPMITKNYSDIEFLNLIEKVNTLNPFAFYIVDSFGSMTLKEFHKYLIISDSNLADKISLGYHSHNNMQLAFSNAISMCARNLNRDIILDSSIYGMGRGAGNLNTELIMDYLNTSFENKYDSTPLLEIIDELLTSLMAKKSWGFSPAQFLSASYNCHPNYANYLVNKNTNNIVSIKKILDKLPEEKKSSFDQELIEKLYRDYVLDPKSKLQSDFKLSLDNKILLIASGRGANEFKELLELKAKDSEYKIIALNHNPNLKCDYYFFTNQKRFNEFKDSVNKNKIVVTNNIQIEGEVLSVLDFKKLVLNDKELVTNSAALVINFLVQEGFKVVEVAGLDGYKFGIENYSYEENQMIFDINLLQKQNQIIIDSLAKLSKEIYINLITPSIFEGKFNEI